MSCIFVHDFRSYKKDGKFYTTNLSYEIMKKRYVERFGILNILNRSGVLDEKQKKGGLVLASGEGIHYIDEIGIFSPGSFFKNYFSIKRIVEKNVKNNDYVIIRLDSFLGLIAAKYCRKLNKPYLVEVVGCVWDSFWNKGAFGKIVAIPLFKKTQYEIKNAPYVVYVTKEFLQNRYPTKGKNTNISNVQLNSLDENYLFERIEKINSFDKNKVYHIVTVASVEVRYKGQDSVIRALYELKKKAITNFQYHLIGGGDNSYLLGLVEQLDLNDQVFFHGSMHHDDVMNFLNDCDIYIQPSKQEGLPRALIEGMSKGLLCFGTRVAGIPELLDQEYIFSKKKNNHLELVEYLSNIDKDIFINQAKRNFNEAKKYEEVVLEKRRRDFFEQFKER